MFQFVVSLEGQIDGMVDILSQENNINSNIG